jgi:hypothetical protein
MNLAFRILFNRCENYFFSAICDLASVLDAAAVEVDLFLQQDFSPFAQPSFFSPAQAFASPALHSFLAFLSLSSPLVPATAELPNKPAKAAIKNNFFILDNIKDWLNKYTVLSNFKMLKLANHLFSEADNRSTLNSASIYSNADCQNML